MPGKPKSYAPQVGYKYQVFKMDTRVSRTWHHFDYAVDYFDLLNLLGIAGADTRPKQVKFWALKLPKQYWMEGKE